MPIAAPLCLTLVLMGASPALGAAVGGGQSTQPAAGAGPAATATATAPATRPGQAAPKRVVLHVNRNLDVAGYVALEDDDVIAVRDLKGQVQSFPKSRVAAIVRLVDPQPDQAGMVVMSDGETREGIIVEDAFDYVLIEIEGIRAKLRRDVVSHVVLQPTVEQRYKEYKAALQPGMDDAHLGLCKWLIEQRRYELARQELLELMEKSELPEARRLLTLVEAQLALNQKPAPAAPHPGGSGGEGGGAATQPNDPDNDTADAPKGRATGPVYPADLLPDQIISRDDVNIMRVFEVDFDHPPKLTITPDTVRSLIEKYGSNKLIPASQTGHSAMFRAAADHPIEIVRLMFELRARDLYPQVQVNSEPYALNLFRQRVHDTWLINNCATSSCHGGPYAGPLFLYRKNYKDERVRYTNLLILERLKLDPQWPLINYEKPEDSLIIQYALPRDVARKPHPLVDGWKAALNSGSQKLKDEAIEWIKAMMQPRPEYPVQFDPPKLGAGGPADADKPAEATARPPR